MRRLRRLVSWIVLAAVSGPFIISMTMAFANDPDEPSLIEEVYVGFYFFAFFVGVAIGVWQNRRHRNPFTKLPRPIKQRRARGPGPLKGE